MPHEDCANSPSAYPSPSQASGIAYTRLPLDVCRSTSRIRALRRRGDPIANAIGTISTPMIARTRDGCAVVARNVEHPRHEDRPDHSCCDRPAL